MLRALPAIDLFQGQRRDLQSAVVACEDDVIVAMTDGDLTDLTTMAE